MGRIEIMSTLSQKCSWRDEVSIFQDAILGTLPKVTCSERL